MIAAHPFSQLTALNAGCDLAVLGATETKSFLAFDQELRNVLTKNNPDGMALLVKFPLRVNASKGS